MPRYIGHIPPLRLSHKPESVRLPPLCRLVLGAAGERVPLHRCVTSAVGANSVGATAISGLTARAKNFRATEGKVSGAGIRGFAVAATTNRCATASDTIGCTPYWPYAAGAAACGAVAATALVVPLAVLAVALTASRVGCSLTDAYYRCQRAPNEGRAHQLERLTSRDGAAGQPSSQLVEGAVGSILAHPLPPSRRARLTEAPPR